MAKLPDIVTKVEAQIKGKRVYKIIGYLGLMIGLLMHDVSIATVGFWNILLFVLLIDLSSQSYELVAKSEETEDTPPAAP